MGRFPALQELLFSSFERRVLSASFFLSVRLIRLRDTFLIQETLSTTRGEAEAEFYFDLFVCDEVSTCPGWIWTLAQCQPGLASAPE